MKKTIYSILALTFVFSGALMSTSCSSDDNSSKEVIVNPNPNPNPNPGDETEDPTGQTFVVTASTTSAYLGDVVTLSATLDGVTVTSGVTYYVDDVAISGNTISSDVEADLLVSAKYQNITSDYVSVSFAVNPFLAIEGEGNFIYNGSTYQVNGAYLVLQGFYSDGNGGATAYWMQYGWSGNNPNSADNFVSIGFDSPATLVGNEITDYVLPNANQNVIYIIGAVEANGQLLVQNQGVDQETGASLITGNVIYNSLNDEANPVTADFTISALTGAHSVSFTYSGDVSPLVSARARMLNGNKHHLQVKSLKDKASDREALIKKILKK